MVVGFNHNFPYQGVVYHVQTEDGGRNSPTIVTLLYRGGTILASRKTSYADITRIDNLAQVVEELMKEQHKGMLRSLKNGEFDEAIARFGKSGGPGRLSVSPAQPPPATAADARPSPRPEPAPTIAPAAPRQPVLLKVPAPPADPPPAPAPATGKSTADVKANLDEIILSYLLGQEK